MKKITLSAMILCGAIVSAQEWKPLNNPITSESAGDESGFSVSLNAEGTTLAIGTPFDDSSGNTNSGEVKVFKRESNQWSLIGASIKGENTEDRLGGSVSLSDDGTILAVGGPLIDTQTNTNNGEVSIYKNTNGTWAKIGNSISGATTNSYSGSSVSINSDGTIIAIGAPGNVDIASGNSDTNGELKIYKNTNNTWSQVGNTITGASLGSLLGVSVSISDDGSVVAVGSPRNANNGTLSGEVTVYKNTNDTWNIVGAALNGTVTTGFGLSVSLNGDGSTLAVSGLLGIARIYNNVNNSWKLIGNPISVSNSNPIGGSVSLNNDGTIVAIGITGKNINGAGNAGQARIFKNENNSWVQVGDDINSDSASDQSGRSVSLNNAGTVVAIGTPGFDEGTTTNTGQVKVLTNDNAVLSVTDVESNATESLLFPVPASQKVTVITENNQLEKAQLFDISGQLIKNIKFEKSNNTVDVSELPVGNYILKIETEKGTITKQIVKK